jgi:ribosomal protein L11 methyltransferase
MRTWPLLVIRFTGEPDLLHAVLSDYDIAAIEETTPDSWRVFFHSADTRDLAAAALATRFTDVSLTPVDVPDEDWAARSQASLRAIQIGNIIVAPPWDVPGRLGTPRPGRASSAPTGVDSSEGVGADLGRPIVVIIQPSMGFGTGHHATTRLCLIAIQNLDLNGRSVIDVGTGSGVLAIAASLLGARPVLAIDDDRDAIEAARESVSINEGTDVETRVMDLRSMGPDRFDVVVANLTGGLLIQAARRLHDLAQPRGHLVLSGFMAHEASDVLQAYSDLAIRARAEEDEWVCVTLHT